MNVSQNQLQTLSIGDDCEILWTIIGRVPHVDLTKTANAFLTGRKTRAGLDLYKAMKSFIVKHTHGNGHPLPMVPLISYVEMAPKYINTNVGKQRWEAFMTAIKAADISGVAPQSADVRPIVGIDAATAEPIFGNIHPPPHHQAPIANSPTSAELHLQTLNRMLDKNFTSGDIKDIVNSITQSERQAAAIAEMKVLDKMREMSADPKAMEFMSNFSKSRLEHVSFAEMRSSVSSSAVVHPVSRPEGRPPMRRTIGNETFVNVPSMMQAGEIVSNPDGTGIRNGRTQQSNASHGMKIDEVENDDDASDDDDDEEGDGTDIDADMVEMADGPSANGNKKTSHALSLLLRELKSWQKQVRADPNNRRANHPYVVVNRSKVTLQELNSIEQFKLVVYKSKNFPYGKIKQRREDNIDTKKPLKMFLAAKPTSNRDGNTVYKITCLMRN
jgi:hypothetical protein